MTVKKVLKNQGGFTLVEMLIVVAIIAILVAISIPMFNSTLEKARKSTDQANLRAAKAAALLDYVSETPTVFTGAATGCYKASTGEIQVTTGTLEKYGKSSALTGDEISADTTTPKGNHIHITLDANGKVTKLWWVSTH